MRYSCAVKIYFVETERGERQVFADRLAEHDVDFVNHLEEVGGDAEAISVFIQSNVTSEFLDVHPRLRLVTTRSTSMDHIQVAACAERGVTVCSVPGYAEGAVAEHTFALILALARRLRQVMRSPKDGRFSYESTRAFELSGRTLGILGMGRVGQRVAFLANAFQMNVIAHDPENPAPLADALHFRFVSLEELLAESDIISLHAPLTTGTYQVINRESLARCKRGVFLVNTARGALIDTSALREALDSGQVAGAGLDVLQDERVMRQSVSNIIAADIVKHLRSDALAHEAHDADRLQELQELMLGEDLISRSNVVFTPHVAFNSIEAAERLRYVAVENIKAFAAGNPINVAT
ncbi:MAG: D-isomer specific 2-hydroxyacid dehydrogenase NAD-binding [Chthoniobacter sp.]|jgi:D-lactate dehydrogenase|nr:D-isomer specific 2-hydroxyacid dehydrogenase NAD-binding [Chthoniobacter sp.]